MQLLHTYNDSSQLFKTTIQEILRIPIWKGNRIMDTDHVKRLSSEIADLKSLDSGYHTIVYDDVDAAGNIVQERFLIDGQHRVAVIKQRLQTVSELMNDLVPGNSEEIDFEVTFKEKRVSSETEAIQYFNTLNNAKPIQYEYDTNLTLNMVLQALEKEYNKDPKNPLIRQGKTRRPYLNVDDVRKALTPYASKITPPKLGKFMAAVREWNTATSKQGFESSVAKNCARLGFFLAYDPKLPWVQAGTR
jgi:hypothetical protein